MSLAKVMLNHFLTAVKPSIAGKPYPIRFTPSRGRVGPLYEGCPLIGYFISFLIKFLNESCGS